MQLVSAEKAATISQTAHLKVNFLRIGYSQIAKLCILAAHPGFWSYDSEEKASTIRNIYEIIKNQESVN